MAAVVAFLVAAVVLWWWFRPRGGADDDQLAAALKGGAQLIDVRTAGEFATGHADGARNIPVDELGLRLADVGEPPGPVVVYCRSGMRSRRAAAILGEAGFEVLDAGTLGRVSQLQR